MIQKQSVFVGREQELKSISEALKHKKNILLLAEKGSGKTALIAQFIKQTSQQNPDQKVLLSSQSASLKNTCFALVECLYRSHHLSEIPKEIKPLESSQPWEKVDSHFASLRTTVLKNLFLNNLRSVKKPIVILDHLGKIKLKFFAFLDSLRDDARLILVARTAQKAAMGRLWMMLWGFETIELQPLTHHETSRLALHWLEEVVEPHERDRCRPELVRLARGNPGVLRDLCEQIRKQSLDKGEIHVRIANIDRQIAGLRQE